MENIQELSVNQVSVPFVTVRKFAELTGINARVVSKLIKDNKIPSFKFSYDDNDVKRNTSTLVDMRFYLASGV